MPAVSWLTEAAWTNLHTLDLSYSDLGRSGIVHLAQGRWPVLSKLDISRLQRTYVLRSSEYASFASLARWPKLTYLSLSHNGMDDECVVQLHSGDWPLLTTLDLSYNDIGAEGAGLAAANWPCLEHLCLYGNKPECCECILGRHIQMPVHVAPKFTRC